MRFRGWCNKSQKTPSTGVLHTNRPWLRQILSIQGDDKEGAQIEHGRYLKGAQIAEDRHKGWTNTGMIPNEIPKIERYEDFLTFHDWLLQHLGGRQRYIIYRINMVSSPHPWCDLERNNWIVEIARRRSFNGKRRSTGYWNNHLRTLSPLNIFSSSIG